MLLSHIQTLGTGAEGGIAKFIYGQTATMSAREATAIALVAAAATVAVLLLFKEFRLACFDREFATAQGWPVTLIDLLMMALVVLVTVIGLRAVGLILVVALIIIPAAAARFWTERLSVMTLCAAAIGAASGYLGAAASALFPSFPAGGVIVLTAGAFFILSMLLAPARGAARGGAAPGAGCGSSSAASTCCAPPSRRSRTAAQSAAGGVALADLQRMRAWSPAWLGLLVRWLAWRGERRAPRQRARADRAGSPPCAAADPQPSAVGAVPRQPRRAGAFPRRPLGRLRRARALAADGGPARGRARRRGPPAALPRRAARASTRSATGRGPGAMILTVEDFLQVDLPAMAACLFATLACTLLGNFLVLRRQSLMGDAVAHAVLPGIVVGFLVAGTRATWPIFSGALLAAVLAAVAIDLVRRYGRLDSGTAMGVVFSIMFAGGVVLMEQAAAQRVDLDAECVLFGQLEDILWLAPDGWASLLQPATWADLPREVVTLAAITVISRCLYRPLL